MDTTFVNAILSNQGLAVLIILALGWVAVKITPKIILYFQERQAIKDKTERERDERYSSLIDRTQEESRQRETKLNKMIEETNIVNMELSHSNRELAESNRILVEGFGDKMGEVGSRIDDVEDKISQMNDKLDLMNNKMK
ncbi:hypothetical protein [uncultured Clostridium sp.]|uniref:hypothetical protein n=1 Tax=uncultured Clostridium sp. TaxID=59620 RepID=UPI003216736F